MAEEAFSVGRWRVLLSSSESVGCIHAGRRNPRLEMTAIKPDINRLLFFLSPLRLHAAKSHSHCSLEPRPGPAPDTAGQAEADSPISQVNPMKARKKKEWKERDHTTQREHLPMQRQRQTHTHLEPRSLANFRVSFAYHVGLQYKSY